jgi:hypothetical protein
MNNLKTVDFYEDNEVETHYIVRINEKLSWPGNASLAVFACGDRKLMKYKILSNGIDRNLKIVVLKK